MLESSRSATRLIFVECDVIFFLQNNKFNTYINFIILFAVLLFVKLTATVYAEHDQHLTPYDKACHGQANCAKTERYGRRN